MSYPNEWCLSAIEEELWFSKLLTCSVEESFATGNPFYPIFNIRNIHKPCKSWFDCYENNPLTSMALNQADIVKKFGANMTMVGSLFFDQWQWSDCNSWNGYLIESQINDVVEEQVDDDGNVIQERLPRQDIGNPNITLEAPVDILSRILEDRDVKVLIINGDLDFHTNFMGTEKVIENIDWYGSEQFLNYNGGKMKRWHFTNTTSGETNVPGGDMRVHDRFTYLRIHNTGIYAYSEKPELMTDLLKQWIADDEGQLRGSFS